MISVAGDDSIRLISPATLIYSQNIYKFGFYTSGIFLLILTFQWQYTIYDLRHLHGFKYERTGIHQPCLIEHNNLTRVVMINWESLPPLGSTNHFLVP